MSIDVNVQNDLVIVTESSEDITVNVSNAPGPAGVGVPTGGSTGQVLKKASATNYDTYWAVEGGGVPYSGATGDVNLGEYELKAGQVEFDQTPTGTAGVGVMRWNDADGTLDLGLKGGNVTLQIGQEEVQRVVNKSGADLLESAYQVVKVTSAQGQRLAVDLAQGNNDANSADTLGIVTETIANNQEGFITTSGLVRGINTTGSLQGETWVDGDVLYLSPTTAGVITNVKPTAPQHTVILGYVVYAHGVNGKIFVKCDNGYELGELHNVYAPTPSNNDGIFWNTANSRYQNNTIAGVLGYTPVPTTRTLTINGTAYDLSADRSWTVSASATPAGSNTQIQYNNSGVFGASAGLVYDDSTGAMTLSKNQNAATNFVISNTTNNANSKPELVFAGSLSGFFTMGKYSNTYGGSAIYVAKDNYFYTNTGDYAFLNQDAAGKMKWAMGNASTAQMTLTAAGRLLLGTTAESTYILDVSGSARFIAASGQGMQIQAQSIGGIPAYAGLSGSSVPAASSTNYGLVLSSNGNQAYLNAGQFLDLQIGGSTKFELGYLTGNVIIQNGGTFTDIASARLQVTSTTQGFLPPRMTTTQKNAITSPATGLQVYDTTLGSLNVYDGTSWIALGAGGGGGMAIGGSITSATAGSVLFAGTSGVLQQNNANLFWDNTNARLGIGTISPATQLHIVGNITLASGTQTTLISNKWLSGAQGNNIFIGGGGQSITGNTFAFSSRNTSVGVQSLNALTTGYYNTAVGYQSSFGTTTGFNNTSIGYSALSGLTTGESNVAIGYTVLQVNNSNFNVGVGSTALTANTTGNYNTAIGTDSLRANIGGIYNTATGAQSLFSNTSGNNNTAIGLQSGWGSGSNSNTSGSNNIFIGYQSVGVSATESNRTWIGNASTTSTWLAGNLLLGSTTSTGQRLQVTGDSKLSGRVSFTPQSTPSTPAAGDVYYDSTTNKLRCYNGTIWNDLF